MVPEIRVARLNHAPVRPDRAFVLYWMIANRRTRWNFALDQAIDHAKSLGRPLVVLEALRIDYPWASERFHQFVLDGMRDNARALATTGALYYPYMERRPGEGRGLLDHLAAGAAVVVTDDFPTFFLPRMVSAVARRVDVAVEAVDANGLLPVRALGGALPSAYLFRRALQQHLPTHLGHRPVEHPLTGRGLVPASPLPRTLTERWPTVFDWIAGGGTLQALPIDHSVTPSHLAGGSHAARARLDRFVTEQLDRYGEDRNHPDRDGTSGLSVYLHWGHLSVHEVFDRVMAREGWLGDLPRRATGARDGWWGVRPAVEAFLDQLVTWRELGFNMTAHRDDYDRFESLPAWAIRTLETHAGDPREHLYDLGALERADTHDPLWNAAQRQLVREGRIHNYLRMLWGKKVLEWTRTPREALHAMVELNNKYALDGRDPNSYGGIYWILGRYDRPWAPERPIFGTVRYMSSANTARKLQVKEYLKRWSKADPSS
jgi:deoxyribodipyrimidine photo-lyase